MTNVTGICIPCATAGEAYHAATTYHIENNVLKVGKSVNQWYCVVIFNKG